MDLTLLKAFVAVAREENITRAARHLHLTQPAVSLQIRNLQQLVGLTLFQRTPRGLVLTQDGHALLPYAERAIACANEVTQAAAHLRQEVCGRLRIGTILEPEFLRLEDFLQRFLDRWPRVETALQHGVSGDVLRRIRAGDLDVGYYIGDPTEDGPDGAAVDSITLTQFNYLVIAPPGWADRVDGVRDWRALASLPWIWTPDASAHRRLLARYFEGTGVRPVKVAEVDQEQSMLDLVKSGVGLTLVREAIARSAAAADALTIVEGLTVQTRLSFVALGARKQEPVIAETFRLIEAQWEDATR